MEQRPLGKTGLNVSILGQGGAAFGQQFGPVSAQEAADTIHAAIDAGVNLVDSAAYYGKGTAEDFLGRALEGGWREKVNICTKACRLDNAEFDFTPAGIIRRFDLRRPLYLRTAAHGHFGRHEFPWEDTQEAPKLAEAVAQKQAR